MKVLAIDQGTTSTRAVLVDPTGHAEVLCSLPHRQVYPQRGWVEHDPAELLANIRTCLGVAATATTARATANPADAIMAVGLANQGESCMAWDDVTGAALGPIIVWQDDRTSAAVEALRSDGYEGDSLARAGLPLDPYFSASKLAWLMRNAPGALQAATAGRLRLGTTDAWFRRQLIGTCATDPSTASRTGLMNLAQCRWDPVLCRLHGVPIEALPPIRPTTGALGQIRLGQISTGLRLTASVVDQQAALYGHGCRTAGDAKITFGTGAFALVVTGALAPVTSGALPTVAWTQPTGMAAGRGGPDGGGPDRSGAQGGAVYALDGGVYAASSAVNWARALGLFAHYSEIETFARPAAIDRRLAFVPALAGLACPHWDRQARGAWMGAGLETDRADMMQALLEGVAMRTAEVIDVIKSHTRLRDPIPIDGGLSANGYFTQFLADILGHQILVSDTPEVTALGTAGLAALGAGLPFAVQRPGRVITPSPHAADLRAGRLARFGAARSAVQAYGAAP